MTPALAFLLELLKPYIGRKIVGGIFSAIFKTKFVKNSLIGIAGAAVFAIGAGTVGMQSDEFKAAVCGAPAVVAPTPTPVPILPHDDEDLDKMLEESTK